MKRIALVAVLLVVAEGLGMLFSQAYRAPSLISTVSTSSVATSSNTQVSEMLTPVSVTFASGKRLTFEIPQHYSMSIAAQGFRAARFMAWSPDHRLFLGEMTSASDEHTGRVIVMDGFDPATGTFASVHTYLDNLRNPNSVAFYTDSQGVQWIYIALTDKLIRYQYHDGDLSPSSAPQVIATFPDFGNPVSEGGWHLTRTLAFDGNTLFVSVGSSCNSCEETDPVRASILAMNPDGSGERVYASGLRNAVGMTYVNGALFATVNEADHLGNDRPNDLVYQVEEGKNYGWPYCYQYGDTVYEDTTTAWQHPIDCASVPLAWAVLPPHSAPLGITYFGSSFVDPALRDSFLVAMHGSGKPDIGTGYEVAIVRQGDEQLIPIVAGFLQDGVRVGRPVDVLQADNSSFFLSDDLNGAIYYLHYQP